MITPKGAEYFYAGLFYKLSNNPAQHPFYWDDFEWKRSSLTVKELKNGHPRRISVVTYEVSSPRERKRSRIQELLSTGLYKDWTNNKLANFLHVAPSTIRAARNAFIESGIVEGSDARVNG